ncbi:hypothetical protein ACJ5NV_03985 [Loktanella agnita]|uniref:hypothetical protein n=1 Tax=Loktanella agnita TaxID=287097 RepID=UPI003987A023
MEFYLVYHGPLSSTQRRSKGEKKQKLNEQRWHIRRAFHDQLKELWRTNKTLSGWTSPRSEFENIRPVSDTISLLASDDDDEPLADLLAAKNYRGGFDFVPLASKHLYLAVHLDVLFMRRDAPGGVVHNGDLDNRVKTLVDCLRMPQRQEMDGAKDVFVESERIYCLMEDDDQLSKLSVETSALLRPKRLDEDDAEVDLIMSVAVKPYMNTQSGLAFV